MKKFNLFGGGFQHEKTSTLDKESKYIIWEYETKKNEISFYVDAGIFRAIKDKGDGKEKYGWLLESRSIVPGVLERAKREVNSLRQVFKFIFTHNKELIDFDSTLFKWSPAYGTYIHEMQIYPKNKLLSMVTSKKTITKNHKLRVNLANYLIKNKSIECDVYGRGFNPVDKKIEAIKDYMFSVAIENDCYETYFTEKILDCFAVGTIPIYMGSPDIGNYFNSEGIIFFDEKFNFSSLTEDLYYAKIEAVKENYEKVLKYGVLEDWIYENYFLEEL